MAYIVKFDDCALSAPLKAGSPDAAIAIAEVAERIGCKNVAVELPTGDLVPLHDFRRQYGGSENA